MTRRQVPPVLTPRNLLLCLLVPGLLSAACAGGGDPLLPPDDAGRISGWHTDAVEDSTVSPAHDAATPDTATPPKEVKPPPKPCIEELSPGAVQAFFSKGCQDEELCPCSPADLGDLVGHFVDGGEDKVDCCVMELQDFSVSDSLADAHKRGAKVRVILDDDYSDPSEYAVEDLIEAGITPKDDDDSRLMHSKFVVIDGSTVLVSSANFSTFDALSNANNLLVFQSPTLAGIFTNRFDQMWAGTFHKSANAGPYAASVADAQVEVFFGPDWSLVDALLEAIEEADEAIHFSIFAFTLDEVKEALLSRCGEVELLGVYDGSQANQDGSVVKWGWCSGATVVEAEVPVSPGVSSDYGFRKLHHKVLIIDPGTPAGKVIAGSTNWSYSAATKNDEVLITVRHPATVDAFESEFQARFNEAK